MSNILSHPEFPLLNCKATYIVSIYNFLANENSIDDIYIYCISYNLVYKYLDVNEVKKHFKSNPWGFQPVKLNIEEQSNLIVFLKNSFGINVNNYSFNDKADVIPKILQHFGRNEFVILSIDEFYNPHSKIFYNKEHNPHGILVKSINHIRKEVEILDTEDIETYTMKYEDIIKASYNTHYIKSYTIVNCQKFKNRINYEKEIEKIFYLNGSLKFLEDLIKDIKFRIKDDTNGPEYYFKGYRFSVLFHIIPYIKMRMHIFGKFKIFNYGEYSYIFHEASYLLNLWKNLLSFMSNQIYLNMYLFNDVICQLEKIYKEEIFFYVNLNEMIHNYITLNNLFKDIQIIHNKYFNIEKSVEKIDRVKYYDYIRNKLNKSGKCNATKSRSIVLNPSHKKNELITNFKNTKKESDNIILNEITRFITIDPNSWEQLKIVCQNRKCNAIAGIFIVFSLLLKYFLECEKTELTINLEGKYNQLSRDKFIVFEKDIYIPNDFLDDLNFSDLLLQTVNRNSEYEEYKNCYNKNLSICEDRYENNNVKMENETIFYLAKLRIEYFNLLGIFLEEKNIGKSIYQFNLELFTHKDDSEVILKCRIESFDEITLNEILNYFNSFLNSIIYNSKTRFSQLLSDTLRKRTLGLVNKENNNIIISEHELISKLFTKKSTKFSDGIFIVFNDQHFTFAALDFQVNTLAILLKEKGVKSNTIVGIIMNDPVDLIISILGILKACGSYLIINSSHKPEEIQHIIADSEVKLILTNKNSYFIINESYETLDVWDNYKYILKECDILPTKSINELIYIRDETCQNRGMRGFMFDYSSFFDKFDDRNKNVYQIDESSVHLISTKDISDFIINELYVWFKSAGKLILWDEDYKTEPLLLMNIIERTNTTHAYFESPRFKETVDYLSNRENLKKLCIKSIFVKGELLTWNTITKFKHLNITELLIYIYKLFPMLINTRQYYLGPWDGERRNMIAKPLENKMLNIISEHGHIQNRTIPGELCILVNNMRWGYLNNPDLTEEEFILSSNEINDRLYHTGDLARWLPDGNIEFMGRIDEQVKIRGFRVELGEIESQLLKHEGIREAVVIARERENDKYLCAYYVSSSALKVAELREFLFKSLPDYMIPLYFVRLAGIPLTRNGKVDKKALPEPEIKVSEGYVAPRDEVEKKLVEIWADVLGIAKDKIGVNDNFFELGGDSIIAIRINNNLKREFQIELPLRTQFDTPSISDLSKHIRGLRKDRNNIKKSTLLKLPRDLFHLK